MGKGEIARYEQFLLSHSVFKRLVLQTRKKTGLVWERMKLCMKEWSPITFRPENNVEKEENAGYQHFLLFQQCFQKASFSGLFEKWLTHQ